MSLKSAGSTQYMDDVKTVADAGATEIKPVEAKPTSLTTNGLISRLIERRKQAQSETEQVSNGDNDAESKEVKSVEQVSDETEQDAGNSGDTKPDLSEEGASASTAGDELDDDGKEETEGDEGLFDELKQVDEKSVKPSTVKKMKKRIDKLTAEREALREELIAVKQSPTRETELDSITTVEDLKREKQKYEEAIDWIEYTLDKGQEVDEDGNKLPFKVRINNQNVEFTREELIQKKQFAKRKLNQEIPQRYEQIQQETVQKQNTQKFIDNHFGWARNEEHANYAVLKSWKSDPEVARLLRKVPDAEAILIAGLEKITEVVNKKPVEIEAPKKPAQKPIERSVAAKSRVQSDNNGTTQLERQADELMKQYKKTKDINIFHKYRAIKKQINSK